jgi:S1-C subfamily serine protease
MRPQLSRLTLWLACSMGLAASALCTEPPVVAPLPVASQNSVKVAAQLMASTVTLRILPTGEPRANVPAKSPVQNPDEGVTVCSGVSLGNGLVVTFASASANSRFRLTLPNGEQAEGTLCVVDHYSGLSLLEIGRTNLPGLEPTKELPVIGGGLLTAAAAGIERPVVSAGILSAVDRSIPGTGLPPLLQCDVRTTETSYGAAIVDGEGRLVGIVAATAAPGDRNGWTYAISVQHVERLVRARQPQQLVVLQRRRPTVGLTMGPGEKEGQVLIERVEAGGPADKAGIRAGDFVVEAEGRTIRSAYQAVDLILKRQPGEVVQLVIRHGEQTRTVDVTLAGSAASLPTATDVPGVRIGPQLNVRAVGRRQIEVRNAVGIQEVAVEPNTPANRLPRDEASLLKAQLAGFEKVIEQLQQELRRRDQHQAKTEELIQKLTEEVIQLRKQLPAKEPLK